jgi:hypothetical protein
MYTYAAVFATVLIANSFIWIKLKNKWGLLIYEFFSGSCLVAAVVIYFTEFLRQGINKWFTLLIIPIIVTDIYMSVWMDAEKLRPENIEINEKELEFAKIFSIIFAAPAYITGIFLLIEKWFRF